MSEPQINTDAHSNTLSPPELWCNLCEVEACNAYPTPIDFYLGAPLTHPDPVVMEDRCTMVTEALALMTEAGHVVFSPVTHSYPMAALYDLPMDHDFWMRVDERFMRVCDKLAVLKLPGWQHSRGLAVEIEYFTQAKRDIVYLDPANILAGIQQ